jgi:hypothetical protein
MILAALFLFGHATVAENQRVFASSLLDTPIQSVHVLSGPPVSWLQTGSNEKLLPALSSDLDASAKDDEDDPDMMTPKEMKRHYSKQSTDEMMAQLQKDDEKVNAETAKVQDVEQRTQKSLADGQEKVDEMEKKTEDGFKDHMAKSLEDFQDVAAKTEENFKDKTQKLEESFKKIMSPAADDLSVDDDDESSFLQTAPNLADVDAKLKAMKLKMAAQIKKMQADSDSAAPSSFVEEGAPDSFGDLDAKLKALEEKTKAELAKLQSDTAAPSSLLQAGESPGSMMRPLKQRGWRSSRRFWTRPRMKGA